eukprot:PhF_6_TR1003/c2_g1_i1/m.1997
MQLLWSVHYWNRRKNQTLATNAAFWMHEVTSIKQMASFTATAVGSSLGLVSASNAVNSPKSRPTDPLCCVRSVVNISTSAMNAPTTGKARWTTTVISFAKSAGVVGNVKDLLHKNPNLAGRERKNPEHQEVARVGLKRRLRLLPGKVEAEAVAARTNQPRQRHHHNKKKRKRQLHNNNRQQLTKLSKPKNERKITF